MVRNARVPALIVMTVCLLGALLVVSSGGPSARAQQLLPCDSGDSDAADYAHVSKKGPYEAMPQQIVELDSKLDGATIQMGLVRPRVPARTEVPVIAIASSYYHPLQTMDLRACEPFLINNYVQHGYAVGLIAIRGTADSGGCMNLMGPEERADLDQAVTWLGERRWSNGSVGMIGKSYDGSTPWMVASKGNPHLKTIVPASGVPDLFALLFGAGTPDWRGPLILADIYYAESMFFYAPGRSPEHTAEVAACPEYADGNAASGYSGATGLMDPLGFWEERRYRDEVLRNYRGSVFLIQGLQDWNVNPGQQFPWIKRVEDRGVFVKYLLGQWGHSWPYDERSHLRPDFADILLDWFDRWLKDDGGARLGPQAQVEDSSGEWRNSSNWPPTDAKSESLWLRPDQTLSDRPSKGKGSEMVAADPVHTQGGFYDEMPPGSLETVCLPGSCAHFETKRFKREFRVAGLPELDLELVPRGPGGGLSAYLYAVSDEGASRLGWGQVNLAFKGPGRPRSVTPGRKMRVAFDLQPLDAVVPAGDRLVLIVSQGSAWNRLPTASSYPITLLEGGRRSALRLLTPSTKPGDFFNPQR